MLAAEAAELNIVDSNSTVNLNCRMYEQRFPEVEDVVIVQVRSIADMGAYVSLLEYNNIEGMILLSELSRRRIRSINKLIKVGRLEQCIVLRVDKEKGYIDLSKRRVSPEDMEAHEEKYSKAKTVHSIMRHCAERVETDLETLYEQIAWPLVPKYGHCYEAFVRAISDPEAVFGGVEMSDALRESLMSQITRKLSPAAIKIRADFELTCYSAEGIDAIKAALFAGEAAGSTEGIQVKVRLIAPPLYVMMTSSMDKKAGIEALQRALEVITTEIETRKGRISVKAQPRATSENEEDALKEELRKLELQNAEVDGDDDNSDSD
jgi:translation initiation factor 2 subunit 1